MFSISKLLFTSGAVTFVKTNSQYPDFRLDVYENGKTTNTGGK
jgi:hypothetical protein